MESKTFNLAMNAIKYVIGIIGAIACVWVLATSPGADAPLPAREDYAASTQMSMAIYYTVIIIIAAVAAVLVFFLFQLITNTKKTAMSIIGVVAAFVFYLILRMIGTTDTNASLGHVGEYEVSDGTLAATTAGLWTVLIGVALGVVLAILGPFIFGKFRK